jgi:hypothetical protein
LANYRDFFSFFNYLIGKLLHNAAPFYYWDFTPRSAGSGCGAGHNRWAGDDFVPRFAGMLARLFKRIWLITGIFFLSLII